MSETTIPNTGLMMPDEHLQTIGPEIDKSGPIRNFMDSGLAAAIYKAVAAIPEGKHVAAIAFADKQGVGVCLTVNLEHGWSIMGVTKYQFGGVLEAQAAIRFVK